MNQHFRWLGVCGCSAILALALLSLWTSDSRHVQAASDSAPGRVSGVVSDSAGAPLAQALVTFATQPPGVQTTVITGKNGAFGVELRSGTYDVTADLRGYMPSEPQQMVIPSGRKSEIKIVLKATRNGFDLESQISGAELLTLLPADSRRTLIHRCGACHTLGLLGGLRMDHESWAGVAQRMSGKTPRPPAERDRDTLEPWAQRRYSEVVDVLAKHFAPGVDSFRYEPFPLRNTVEHLSKVVITEYTLTRPEIDVHDVTVDASGRVWYADEENQEDVKNGFFGWYDPATGESKEYQVPQCRGFSPRIVTDKSGRVWIGCAKALAYWSPSTDQLTIFPLEKYGLSRIWALDSKGNAYTMVRGKNVEPERDPKISYIGKFSTETQQWTLYKIPSLWGEPYEAMADSKDNIWFTEIAANNIGKLDPRTGKITEYPVPTKAAAPRRFSIDSKDNVWFGEFAANKIGMLDSRTGKITEYETPTPNAIPYAVGVDRNDVVWFSEIAALRLARFDPRTKTFREYPIPDRLSSIKNMGFTYSEGKQFIWGSHATGPKFIGFQVPAD